MSPELWYYSIYPLRFYNSSIKILLDACSLHICYVIVIVASTDFFHWSHWILTLLSSTSSSVLVTYAAPRCSLAFSTLFPLLSASSVRFPNLTKTSIVILSISLCIFSNYQEGSEPRSRLWRTLMSRKTVSLVSR